MYSASSLLNNLKGGEPVPVNNEIASPYRW